MQANLGYKLTAPKVFCCLLAESKETTYSQQAEAMARAQFCHISSSGGTNASIVFSW